MAYSQIEVVSPSHYGCIIKERNHEDRHTDTNSNITQDSQTTLHGPNNDFYHHGIDFDYWGKSNASHRLPLYKKPSKTIDQWATQQAKDMINTSERDKDDVVFTCLSKTCSLSSRASSSKRDPSPTPSDNSSTDLSVSSLVQKWRGFEAESKYNQTINNNINIQGHVLVLDNDSNADNMVSTTIEDNQKNMETPIFQDRLQEQIQQDELHLQKISSSIDRREEEERIRVADIVRKWANSSQRNDDGMNQECKSLLCPSLMRLKIGFDVKDQHPSCHSILSSPKLRGRQAISELFKRMERERLKEVETLKSKLHVSKFPHRGRIQTILRLNLLRREVSAQNDQPISLPPLASESILLETTSNIRGLREIYSPVKNQDTKRDIPMNVPVVDQAKEKTFTPEDTFKQNDCEKTGVDIEKQDDKLHSGTQKPCTSIIASCETKPRILYEENVNDSTSGVPFCDDNELTCQNFDTQSTKAVNMDCATSIFVEIDGKDEESDSNYNIQIVESNPMDCNTWEKEQEEEDEEDVGVDEQEYNPFLESNLDWTIDIARPRSYWEGRRQAWYQEIYTTHSQDEEIRQLLERGNVSSVLASDFRDKMDRLVMCSIQKAYTSTNVEGEDREESEIFVEDVANDQSIIPSKNLNTLEYNNLEQEEQEHLQESSSDVNLDHSDKEVDNESESESESNNILEDVNMGVEDDNERTELVSSARKYQDISEDPEYDQVPSSSQSPWNHHLDHEMSDDSDHIASTFVRKHQMYHSYYQDTREGPSLKMSSFEMELILDLRAHMQQLHNEMSELRKTITSCVDMQLMLQQSLQDVIPISPNFTKNGKAKKSSSRITKGGRCCMCYEKAINTVLYRCGHMCTCFNCAHKLQSSTGKCPICQADVIDVVRICTDT